jgi:hypothetical protein
MHCHICHSTNVVVLESRFNGSTQRRRRQCSDCTYKFTTYEITDEEYQLLKTRAKKLEEINQAIKVIFEPIKDKPKPRQSSCPCNSCIYASGSHCSHDYPEYGTMQAVDCNLYTKSGQ